MTLEGLAGTLHPEHMVRNKQCVAIIPCLNEAASIQPLVRAVLRQLEGAPVQDPAAAGPARHPLPVVIVVDDGSTDGTGARAEEAGARVLTHSFPQGKGAALATGLREAHRLGFSRALVLDGDGQHAPGDIPAFLACAAETHAQLIIGNRMNQAHRMPWLRRAVNRWMSRRLSRLSGQPLPDSQCGFRLIHLGAWSSLLLTAQHFEVESEMVLAFIAAGARVEFVPIQVIYKGERSKIHPWRDTWRWFKWLRRWKRAKP